MILTFFHLKSPCRTKNLIGEVEFGVFQQVDRSHLLVGTKENVIASLSPKNGNICSFYYPLLPSLLSSLLSPLLSSLPSSLLSPLLAFLIFSSLSFISTVWRHVMESSNRLIHMEAFGKGTALSLFPSFPSFLPSLSLWHQSQFLLSRLAFNFRRRIQISHLSSIVEHSKWKTFLGRISQAS